MKKYLLLIRGLIVISIGIFMLSANEHYFHLDQGLVRITGIAGIILGIFRIYQATQRFLPILLISILLWSCNQKQVENNHNIVLVSVELTDALKGLETTYNRLYPKEQIMLQGMSNAGIISSFMDDDIIVCIRTFKPIEEEIAYFKERNISLEYHPMATTVKNDTIYIHIKLHRRRVEQRFGEFVLSNRGQKVLEKEGFEAIFPIWREVEIAF